MAVANDNVPGNLMKNDGHAFRDIAQAVGTAFEKDGGSIGGMGVDWGDYDNDGQLDLVEATFRHQAKCIFHNDGGVFSEESSSLGIVSPTLPYVAFGVKWLDYDNDGWLDFMMSNGHVQDNVAEAEKTATYREPTQLFHNEAGKRFTDSTGSLAGPAGRPLVGRGLAIGDFDNDGRIDALVVDSEGAPLLLHNETQSTGHWIEIGLTGTKSNRDAQGAIVTVRSVGRTIIRQCTTGGSYLSSSDRRVHIGLGTQSGPIDIELRWPSGKVDKYSGVAVDHIVSYREQ